MSEWRQVRAQAGMQGERAQGPGSLPGVAGTESRGEIGGGVGVQISRAHASVAAILAFAFGALAAWAVPAMIRDAKVWRDELWPRPRR